jgi:VWFA-related protein
MKTALVLAVALALPLTAQTPYIETFEVRLHNLDVVVTDAKGEPVRGLSKADFVVLENGRAQDVTNFSVYDTRAGKATQNATPETTTETTAETAAQPAPRRFVFFIDEFGVQKMAREKLYAAVKQFVDAMHEGDLASVVRPTSVDKVVQEFTGDRAAVEQAVKAAIDENDPKYAGAAREIYELQHALAAATLPLEISKARHDYAAAARRRVEHRLGQIRALTSSLAGMEGRKVVVLVSMGLSARPGLEAWNFAEEMGVATPPVNSRRRDPLANDSPTGPVERVDTSDQIVADERPAIDDIARTAAANGVTIYALEPDVPLPLLTRGAAHIGVTGDDDFGPDTARDLPPGFHTDVLQNAATTLDSLTEKTGGKWFRGLTGIDDTFRTVTGDLSLYYSLAYRATGNAEKARRVEVKVRNRPELRVRTRTEVIEKSTSSEMQDLTIASLIYPRDVNELGIEVTAGTPVPALGFFTIPLDILIPLEKLTFLQNDKGDKYVASFDVHFAAAGQKRDFLTGGKTQQVVEITPAQYEEIAGTSYRYQTGIKVAEGPSKIAIGVLDTTTKLTGFQTVAVDAQ